MARGCGPIAYKLADKLLGLRVPSDDERQGLDITHAKAVRALIRVSGDHRS